MGELTVLAATLQHLHKTGKLVVSEASDATGLDGSTIYRWISGDADPSFGNVVLLFKHCGNREAQAALLAVITSGTDWFSTPLPTELDIDGDGDVDIDDAMTVTIEACEILVDLIKSIQQSKASEVDDARVALHNHQAQNVIEKVATHMRVMSWLNERTHRRRKARPLVVGGSTHRSRHHG